MRREECLLSINQSKNHAFPKTKQAWANFINSLHFSALNERQATEMQWARNIAYYMGFQHLAYDATINLIEVDGGREDEYIINRIAPHVEQRVAKLTRSKPILTVIPDRISPEVVKAAEISEKLLKHLWKVNEKDDKLDTCALYMALMGSAFIKTVWNPEGGEPLRNEQDEEGNVVFDEETGRQKPQLEYLGDIYCLTKSPFDILVSSGVKDLKYAPWIIERSFRTAIELQEKFKEFDLDKVTVKQDDMTRFEKFVNTLGCPTLGVSTYGIDRRNLDTEIKEQGLVLVKEFWMKPNMVYPQGIRAVVACDQLLLFEAWDYEHKEFPYVKMDEHKNPFGFYGISTVSRLIPIQQHYNQARTQIAKNAQLMANIKWWAAKGCGLIDDAMTDEQGEIIETNPNMPKPEQIGIAPLPNYIIENQNQDILDMRDVGGERESSQLPFPGLTAGVALETAAELSDISLGPTLKSIERALCKAGRQELILANQFYTDNRTLKVIGDGSGKNDVIIFNNEDLKYQTDVTIQLESSLAYSKTAAKQNLIDMWDRRIVTDPDAFMKAFTSGNLDIILKAKNPAESVVIEDIEMIKQGKEPVVSQYDNHILYIKMLSAFIQTPEFRKMPEDRQMIAANVLQQHLAFMQPQQPMAEENQAAVNTPFGEQVPEGLGAGPEVPQI